MIKEVRKFTDDDGRTVKAYYPYISKGGEIFDIHMVDSESKPYYEGTVGIRTPDGRIAPIDFPFPDDYTLEQCFENFEDIANKEIKKIMDKQEDKNRIITPG